MVTKQDIIAAIQKTKIIADAVKEAGTDGIPSGHLYAIVMSAYSLSEFQQIIDLLKRNNIIQEKEVHLLVWCAN